MDAVCDPELPLHVAGLSLLVDQEADDRRAVFLGEAHDRVEPGSLALPVLEVRRVEDRASSEPFQAGFHDGWFGRVEDDRGGDAGGEALGEFVHVDGAVPSDVVDAQVDDMGRLGHLANPDADAGIPVLGEERLAELLGAVGIRPLPDDQEGRVLVEGHERVDR